MSKLQRESEHSASRTSKQESRRQFTEEPFLPRGASNRWAWFKAELELMGLSRAKIQRVVRRTKLDDLPFTEQAMPAFAEAQVDKLLGSA